MGRALTGVGLNELLGREPMENVMQHETTPNDNQVELPEPKFGEWLRGIHASETNPHRDGMYVRTIRRTGKLNPGVHYEVTDGNGKFWQYPAQSVERLATPPAVQPAGGEAVAWRFRVDDDPSRHPFWTEWSTGADFRDLMERRGYAAVEYAYTAPPAAQAQPINRDSVVREAGSA